MTAALDHLVVPAPTLAAGAEYVCAALGVELAFGGAHPRMGTHNMLLKLGDDCYLEVIAPDPAAPPPGRPRWFALDTAEPPRLAAWVARDEDFANVPKWLGPVEEMARGDLRWRLTVPADGRPPLGGTAPHLIRWAGPHPAARLPDAGCSLLELVVTHPDPDRVKVALAAVAFAGPVAVRPGPVGLLARIKTPAGERSLG